MPGQAGTALDLVDPDGRFVGRALADPKGNPALRVFSGVEGEAFDAPYLRRRLQASLDVRRRLGHGTVDGYRLLSGDSEGVPAVTVDSYAGYLVVCAYSDLVTSFEQALVAALADLVHPPAIYVQRRAAPPAAGPRPGAELVFGQAAPPEVVLTEGRCRFVVDVSAPASPGLFLDMRRGREAVARLAGGRSVLNCFSYTGAFSVVAALHGARAVVSVDSASRAHGRARRNFDENRIPVEPHEFITGDTFALLAQLAERHRTFEMVILDPPTYSTGKGRAFTALKDYAELVQATLPVLAPGGILLACCNAAKLSAGELDRAVGRGASQAGRRLVVSERLGLPPDFPVLPAFTEGDYLKILVARVE